MTFPMRRPRRLRQSLALRELVRETTLAPADFIHPLFVAADLDACRPIPGIPGMNHLSGRPLEEEVRAIADLGIPAVLLFGMPHPEDKDDLAKSASSPTGSTQEAVRVIRKAAPGLAVITDLCLCEFNNTGHCGVFRDGKIDNDLTLERIRDIAVSQAAAGANVVAPSGMMDGVVQAIRSALDEAQFSEVLVMPYSAKFASQLYGPFKKATDSTPSESLHATHQIDIANRREALREIALDVDEGADIVIVKPATSSLDIIAEAHRRFSVPIAAYHVSGSYRMLWDSAGDDEAARCALMMEALTCIRRAGADMIITYFAKEAARLTGRR